MDRTNTYEYSLGCPKKRHCLKSFSGDSPAVQKKDNNRTKSQAIERAEWANHPHDMHLLEEGFQGINRIPVVNEKPHLKKGFHPFF